MGAFNTCCDTVNLHRPAQRAAPNPEHHLVGRVGQLRQVALRRHKAARGRRGCRVREEKLQNRIADALPRLLGPASILIITS